ncbi:carboxymuconolactone decarboxylase family protein [Leptospira adleri]|uniref:carboxymuconolactone decarboxylase family protein n=1 Tax=Leptospira adleri TaxID=2023186 RepID=UPI0010841A18|nr:carboxymuconolactone decarboxylase family protein [Leptospira adleri]TGM56628.1 carboxymuconolactone decarboxylase family protein [Leptospira adleri]
MSRISLTEYETSPQEVKEQYERQIDKNGQITHMKRTLLHSLPSYKAYMKWYVLRDEIVPFLGERTFTIFAHSISSQTDCLICSTFFRRILIEWGESPDSLLLDPIETLLVEFGRQIATDSNSVSDPLYEALRKIFDEEQIVLLTAFAGIMIATNVFNNVLRIDLDPYLENFTKKEQGK